jgi:hypothetical protein
VSYRSIEHNQVVACSWERLVDGVEQGIANVGSRVVLFRVGNCALLDVDGVDMARLRHIKELGVLAVAAADIENLVTIANKVGGVEGASEGIDALTSIARQQFEQQPLWRKKSGSPWA